MFWKSAGFHLKPKTCRISRSYLMHQELLLCRRLATYATPLLAVAQFGFCGGRCRLVVGAYCLQICHRCQSPTKSRQCYTMLHGARAAMSRVRDCCPGVFFWCACRTRGHELTWQHPGVGHSPRNCDVSSLVFSSSSWILTFHGMLLISMDSLVGQRGMAPAEALGQTNPMGHRQAGW